jgi:thioredoxin 1
VKTRFPGLTQFDFHHTIEELRGTSLVIFTSEGCASCRHWRRLLGDYRARHPDVRIFEVDAQRDLALTREFEVFHLPALFVFRDGAFHGGVQSEARVDALAIALARALAAPPQESP